MERFVPIVITAFLAIIGFVGIKFWDSHGEVSRLHTEVNVFSRDVIGLEVSVRELRKESMIRIRDIEYRLTRIEALCDEPDEHK